MRISDWSSDVCSSDRALVVWMRGAGIEPGDRVTTRIAGPDGAELFSETWKADQTRIVQFRYAGKKRPAGGWAAGTYTGRIVLERDGRPPRERTVTIEEIGRAHVGHTGTTAQPVCSHLLEKKNTTHKHNSHITQENK